jgi:hypothetical protein
MAKNMLILTLHLIQSALSQKVEPKPAGDCRDRSQCATARLRSDVAGLPSRTGLPMSRPYRRASALLAKSVLSASPPRRRDAADAVSGVLIRPVPPAIMPSTRKVHSTDEVLRRLTSLGWVMADYKPDAKGQLYASVRETASSRLPLQGWQQRRSRGAVSRVGAPKLSERQNLRVPLGSGWYMGAVSPDTQTTKWLDGTSSCPVDGTLSNIPQQPATARVAVHPH